MDIIESMGHLILLTKRNISLADIGDALNIGRAGASGRASRKTELKPEDIKMIEDKFNVILPKGEIGENISYKLKDEYNLSRGDLKTMDAILTTEAGHEIIVMILRAMQNNNEASLFVNGLSKSPMFSSQYMFEDNYEKRKQLKELIINSGKSALQNEPAQDDCLREMVKDEIARALDERGLTDVIK